ncbi:unnamed protein product [Parnassius mnemosyne]|uniref:Uncharacterized protein n=1 Tax=Parnassius mnemosyne TaxID=213953 RepID=A0AAV1LSP5_9NEOP
MMHLTNLKQDLEIRFPDTSHGYQWIINPFSCDLNTVKMNLKEKEQLIDLILNVEPDLRVSVSDNISPRINILTASVQAQGSH